MNFFRLMNLDFANNQRITIMAFIVKGGNIISCGQNDYKRIKYKYKELNHYGKTKGLHAELNAINNCRNKKRIRGAKMIVVGMTRSGNLPKSTRPCKNCMNAIRAVGISKVVYYNSKGEKIIEKI